MTSGNRQRVPLATALLLLVLTTAVSQAATPGRLGVHATPRSVPEVSFENGAGDTLTLADFRGRVVALNLWETWCPPCRKEMPTLDRLQMELGGEHFEVIALSIDRAGPGVVRDFYAEEGIENLKLYIDMSMRAMPRLGVSGIPTTLVLDARGREVARLVGEADWATPAMLEYFRGLMAAQTRGGES